MKNILVLLFFCGIVSCASEPVQKLSPAVYYKNDMCFWHLGKKFCGVGVIQEKEEMFLTMDTHNNIDTFMLTTCHREIDTANPDKGLRRKNGIVTMQITPTLERGKACPYYFASFNREGKHSWGAVAIQTPEFKLQAKAMCNGGVDNAEGVYICQSREGLLQKIIFSEPVKITKAINGPAQRDEDCPDLKLSEDKRTLDYITPNRECLYGFIGEKTNHKFKLYTIGYEEIVVR